MTYMVSFNKYPTVEPSVFMPEILLVAKGATEDIARHFLYDVVVDFCTRTGVLTHELVVELLECDNEYKLDVPECERLLRFNKICVGDKELDLNKLRDFPCGGQTCCGGYELRFVPPDTLFVGGRMTHTSCHDNILKAFVTTTPKRDSCTIPEIVYERYYSTIVSGVLSKLLLVPDMDIGALAQYHERKYEQGVSAANRERILSYGPPDFRLKTKVRM